jgi:hypothetical protein
MMNDDEDFGSEETEIRLQNKVLENRLYRIRVQHRKKYPILSD